MRPEKPAVVSVFGVEPLRIGGTETYARELSAQLDQHGWRSVLIFVTPPPEQVRRFLDLPNISVELLDYARGFKLGVLSSLAEIMRRHQPKIVHFHYGEFLTPYPWLASLMSAEQVFFTDHSSRPASHSRERAAFPKRYAARAINWPVSKVICVSDYGYQCFTARGFFPPDKCEMIYNGVDLSRVVKSNQAADEFRRRYSIPQDRTVILQVSWIIPEKGILDLLAAARIVVSQNPKAHFVIVGEGPFRDEYTKKAAELGLSDHVTWTGTIEDPFNQGVYDVADVVCQVSRWEEVFGWTIAEAMSYGKPVIATRVGGIPELVAHNESGFLVERGDVNKTAEKILILMRDPVQRERMGEIGRKIVNAKFDLQKNVSQLVRAYGIGTRLVATG